MGTLARASPALAALFRPLLSPLAFSLLGSARRCLPPQGPVSAAAAQASQPAPIRHLGCDDALRLPDFSRRLTHSASLAAAPGRPHLGCFRVHHPDGAGAWKTSERGRRHRLMGCATQGLHCAHRVLCCCRRRLRAAGGLGGGRRREINTAALSSLEY